MLISRHGQTLKVSAIIPAYNEAKNLLRVLEPLTQVSEVTEIIVVSDGSTDETARLAGSVDGVSVLELPRNLGKTGAALRGVVEAQYPVLLFCDADLVNLKPSHVSDLIRKFCEGWDMVIMDKGSQPWVFRRLLRSVPAVSGTRILEKRHLLEVPFRAGDRFQFENRINDHFLANGLRIAVSPAPEIHDTRKFIKYPFWRGLALDVKGGWEVMASDGPASIPRNYAMFQRIWRIVYSKQGEADGGWDK